MTDPNTRQVGGEHYRTEGLQHWDLISRSRIGYLEGNATKYLSRWRKKNGVQDLEKALHYVDKILHEAVERTYRPAGCAYVTDLKNFCQSHQLTPNEAYCMEVLCSFWGVEELRIVQGKLNSMIVDARAQTQAAS